MHKDHYTLKDVAAMLNVARHKITYAITSGLAPEPSLRIGNVRVWSQNEFELLAKKLNSKNQISTAEDK
jgi:hypothetical protein